MKLTRCAAMLCALALTAGGVTALAAVQGSQDDPLITLSYLESVLRPQLESQVDAAVAENEAALVEKLSAAAAGQTAAADAAFQTRELRRGESFTPGAGRELLALSGALTALGELTDTTAGKRVAAGEALEEGHLYVTATDAAGCRATAAASVMSR